MEQDWWKKIPKGRIYIWYRVDRLRTSPRFETRYPAVRAKKDKENERQKGRQICESIENSGGCGALETTKAEITLSSSRVDEGLPVFN